MKLEFEKDLFDQMIVEELEFDGFLQEFSEDISIISNVILRPLSKVQVIKQYQQIQTILSKGQRAKELYLELRSFPNLDKIFAQFAIKNIGPYELHLIKEFLDKENSYRKLDFEKRDENVLLAIEAIIDRETEESAKQIYLSEEEKKIKLKLEESKQEFSTFVKEYEKAILDETSLTMTYPYKKEIPDTSLNISKVKSSKYIEIKNNEDGYMLIGYKLPKQILDIKNKIERLEKAFDLHFKERFKSINDELANYYKEFKEYYEWRKERIYHIILANCVKKINLTIPVIDNESVECNVENARLPILEKMLGDKYTALSMTLNKGSSVIFGPNMAGKTTVLKTLYFILSLIKVGLPVPATNARLVFPENVYLHLKSAGNIQKNLSSFAEEITFFTNKIKKDDYILVDELFQSTNPVSGAELSEIYLDSYNKKDIFFFVSTQYPTILKMKKISLYKMKESETYSDDILNNYSYKVETIDKANVEEAIELSKKALKVALHFDIEDEIKEKIKERIEG